MSKFYDQLLISDDEVIVNKSQALSLFKKWLTLLVAAMCVIFSVVTITQTTFWFRYLTIPVFAAFLVYYAFGYAKIGTKENMLTLKVNGDELEYRNFVKFEGKYIAVAKNKPCVIKMENVVNVEDKSYFNNDDYGPGHRGWHHDRNACRGNYVP